MTTIDFSCPQCGHTMKLSVALIGKKGKCPKCGMVNEITNPAGTQQTAPVTQQQPTPPQQPDPFQQQIPPQQPAVPQNPLGGMPQAPAGPLGGMPNPPQQFQQPDPFQQQIPPQQPTAPQNPLGGIPQLPAGPLGGMPNPPQQFQQQAIPQLPTDSSNKNRMKLWIILGSSILFVIILAIGFFVFSGDDTKNELANDQSSNQSPSETSTASNGTTSQQNENKQVASISKLPTNPSDVMERLARALILAETSIDDAMKMLEPCILDDQDLEKAVGYFLTNQSKLPEAKRTLSKSELLADIKQSFRTRLLENLKRDIEKEIRSGESIHTQSWAHSVLSRISWSDMEYVTSIYSLKKKDDDFGGANHYLAVAILKNEGTYFYISMVITEPYSLLPGKFYVEDDFKSFCLTSATALNSGWKKVRLDELRSRKNPELAPLIAIIESKPVSEDLTVEQSSALRDARPKPSKNDILKAIEITKTQKLEEISINEFAVDKEILEKIVSVESLKDLSIRRGQLTDNDMILLLGCKSLTRLSLAHNLITPKSTDLLSKYSNLDFLYLVGNPICDSDASKAALNKAYPDANIFFE